MKYGIISDIHSNYPALIKVLDFLKEAGAERIINCGDITGYGPEPNRCVEEVRNNPEIFSVLGNHDSALLKTGELVSFNPSAEKAVRWTSEKLKAPNAAYLAGLKTKRREEGVIAVHGSLRSPLNEYVKTPAEAAPSFLLMKENISFIGHTHIPGYFQKSKTGIKDFNFVNGKPVKINKRLKYIINAGSVGQPRDGDSRACCLIYEAEKEEVTLFRIKYDIKAVQKKMNEKKLPPFLSWRLKRGM